MKREYLENRLQYINYKIEMKKESFDFRMKMQKRILIIGSLCLISIITITFLKDKMNGLDVFSISLMVSSLYALIRDHMNDKTDRKYEEIDLNAEKEVYEMLLKELDEEESKSYDIDDVVEVNK